VGGGGGGGGETTGRYRGAWDALRTIARAEGVSGVFKGFVPSILLVSHGAIQLTAYEGLREAVGRGRERNARTGKREIRPDEAGAIGLASKFIAISTTYPLQVIRSRMQQREDVPRAADAPTYRRFTRALAQTVRREGFLGLYKGFVPNALRVLPNSAVTFAAYEGFLVILNER